MTESLFPDLIERIEPPKADPVAAMLIETGFVPNNFVLDLNKGLTIPPGFERPYPWSLPSRLFIFPIEISAQAEDGTRKVGLLHPLLVDHPFVKHVETTLGIAIDPKGAPNEYGYTKVETGKWWHAVDLISHGMWRELIDTARFTTPENIANAVSYGLDYSPYEDKKRNGHISTTDARIVMAAIDTPEPADAFHTVNKHFWRPSGIKEEKDAERWPINTKSHDAFAAAWGHILAIEAGWFAHDRAGFLGWTARGRERFPPEPKEVKLLEPARLIVPPPPFTADEIPPRPPATNKTQLDLF